MLLAGVPSVVIIDRMSIPNGLGRDVWTVPFSDITAFVRSLYALAIIYFLEVALVKATVLFFFLRIFPSPKTRRLIRYTLIFNALYGIVFTLIGVFLCRPISYYWTHWNQEKRGQCVDINALVWINATISIILDVWMLIVPLCEVFYLQMSWHHRINVTLMFFVGTL